MADGAGYRSVNPLFMKYTPTDGYFSGQQGYGYRYTLKECLF
jgi:D-galacturonate reductase